MPFVTQKGTKEFTPLCTEKCVLINYTETLVNLNSKPFAGFWEHDENNWVSLERFLFLSEKSIP